MAKLAEIIVCNITLLYNRKSTSFKKTYKNCKVFGQRFCYFIIDHKGAVILILYTVPLFIYRYLKISKTKNTIAATYVLFVTIPKAIGNRADNTT